MQRITETVKVLITINVLFFIGSLSLQETSFKLFAVWFPYNPNFSFWQPITYMFMHSHSDIYHILLNMLFLFMFGSDLERLIGQTKFLFLYFSAGFGALGLQLLYYYIGFQPGFNAFLEAGFSQAEILELLKEGVYDTRVLEYTDKETINKMFGSYVGHMVGASGAISGVIAASLVYFWNTQLHLMFLPFQVKGKHLLLFYFASDILGVLGIQISSSGSNIAHWAHIGGALIGIITIWYWKRNSFN